MGCKNLLMILRTVDTRTLRSLEMDCSLEIVHVFPQLFTLFSILTACKCDYYIAHTCYLPHVYIQITGASHAWKAIISYNFDKVAIILSSPFFEFCVKFYQVWLFFSFFSSAVQTKTISTWIPKTFATGTIFWEKCCIFWQSCKGADIFGHDCIWTEQNYKRNTFVFAPIFHELNTRSKLFLFAQKAYFSQILFTNLSKSVLVTLILCRDYPSTSQVWHMHTEWLLYWCALQ